MRNAIRRLPGSGARGAIRSGVTMPLDRSQEARSSRTALSGDLGTGQGWGVSRAHHRRRRTPRDANRRESPCSCDDYAAGMDLSYPADAEAFRTEIRAWLEENLPQGWFEDGFSMTAEERSTFNKDWTETLFKGGW